METKHIQPQIYFCLKKTTTLNSIHESIDEEVEGVYTETGYLQLEVTGPMSFIYFNCTSDRDKPFDLYIALSVKEMLPLRNSIYSYHEADTFDCLVKTHEGDIYKLGETYEELFQELHKNGIEPTNQIREVYTRFVDMVSPENITEIQVGVQDA